jgi:hypothetical protein
MLAVAAACLVAALAAPSAGAAAGEHSSSKSAASSPFQVKAHAAVTKKRLAQRIRTVDRRSRLNRRNIRRLGRSLRGLGARLQAAIAGGDKSINDRITGIVAVVTPVLTQLGDAARALEAGLKELAAATTAGFAEVTAGFGEVETALTDIGDYLGATEYGFGQVMVFSPAQNAQAGSFVVTPDMPDTVQQAMTEQQFVAQHTGALGVLYGIRSGENDGTGADNPAGHCRVTVTNEAGQTGTTAANAGLGGLPFQPVPDKSALTSEDPDNAGFPFGLKTDDAGADEEDKYTAFVSSVNVTAGDTYTVGLSCVDISASADDPEA